MRLCLNIAAGLLALAPARAGASSAQAPAARARWAMGTLLEIEAPGASAAAAEAAFAEVARWEKVLASCRHREDSENCALERAAGKGPVPVSRDLFAASAAAMELSRRTGGAFDPAYRGPGGRRGVRLDPRARTVSLPPGGSLDFGGIGKGWALDRAAEALRARGVRSARLNFGGQILALGAPEGAPGWEASIPGAPAPVLLKDESVSVSGNEQQPGHIRDPATGRPVLRPGSAAAVARTATEADAWSTALFVLGRKPAAFHGRAFFAPVPKDKTGDTP